MRALVLSGGAAKGAYQVGALARWVCDQGADYQIFLGTSVGAINSAWLAQAAPGKLAEAVQHLRGIWWDLENRKVFKKWTFGEIAALWQPSMYNGAPLRKLISDNLDTNALVSSGRKLRVVACSWRTGEKVIATEEHANIAAWVYASASMPVFFDPANIGGQLYTDGGLRDIAPIAEALKLGAEEVDVIVTSDPRQPYNWDTRHKSTLQYALHAVDIMSDEILLNDIKECELKNRVIRFGAPFKRVKLRVLIPSRPVGDPMNFSSSKVRQMIAFGYEDAGRL